MQGFFVWVGKLGYLTVMVFQIRIIIQQVGLALPSRR